MRPTVPRLVFTLAVLFGINTMNFYDRQVLSAVQEKVIAEWKLEDVEVGLLGTAFIVLYAIVGLPLGRLADVWNRRWILVGGVALWSVFTLTSGFAWGFWSLLVMRLGVGVGEASCAPTASSLIADLFPAERRARAMSIFMLGLPIGLATSFLVSSSIAQRYDWRQAFYVAAIPGLLLAVAAVFIADPPRPASSHGRPQFLAAARLVLAPPTMWWIIVSGALHNFNMYALGTFLASLLKRYHEVSVAHAGQVTALAYGFGAIGIFVAGWLGDRAFRRSPSGRLTVAWVAIAGAVPCLTLALAMPRGEIYWCAACLLAGCLMLYVYYGTIYATIQDITPPSLVGMAMAVYFCAMYTFAVFGPVATGWLSDYFVRQAAGSGPVEDFHKALGLRDAMFVVPILNALLAVVLFIASRTVKNDIYRRSNVTA